MHTQHQRFVWPWTFGFIGLASICLWFGLQGCGNYIELLPLVENDKANLRVVYSVNANAGVKEAAEAIVKHLSAMTGKSFPTPQASAAPIDPKSVTEGNLLVIGQMLLSEQWSTEEERKSLGEEGYILQGKRIGSKGVLLVTANNNVGLQYGAFDWLRSLGVRFHHPSAFQSVAKGPASEGTYVPFKPNAVLLIGSKRTEVPGFALRGFHHHTQHPIPMATYLLEPSATNLQWARQYMRWLVRNRQNVLQWYLLKTVDRPKWVAYVRQLKDIAKLYGIKLAITFSFADQQQNSYRLLQTIPSSQEEQAKIIRRRMDEIQEANFDYLVVQIGTSEFTKVADKIVLGWMDAATKHLKPKKIPVYTWIHTAGELKADDEKSYFYHLPEKTDSYMGAYVHTTMFYDMKNPAPVYSNEDFSHQRKFLERIDGQRNIVYFPETAWWLGFDVNLPLALPITGHSRGLDILEILKPHKVKGHVNFTSGMEWGYWKYDHYLTRVTWDRRTTWEDYLKDFAKSFGSSAELVANVLKQWTDLQIRDFYGKNPRMIFYITGELLQDEIGQQAGVLARSPKRSFTEILNLKEADYKTWEQREFKTLQQMEKDYTALFQKLPATAAIPAGTASTAWATTLYQELHTTLQIYVWRLQHTVLLYDAVRSARQGREDGGVGAGKDKSARGTAQSEAKAKILKAKEISQKVIAKVKEIESKVYRYPIDILATERTSLSSYKFGYLWETRTGHFWTRRDKQAETLTQLIFGELKEEWGKERPALQFHATAKKVKITEPNNATVQSVLASFTPGFILGIPENKGSDGPTAKAWLLAVDQNENKKPDITTTTALQQGKISVDKGEVIYTGQTKLFRLPVIDKAGNSLGELGLEDFTLRLVLERTGDQITTVKSGTVTSRVKLEGLVKIATQVAGLERDGLLTILGPLLGFDPKNPPLDFEFSVAMEEFTEVK